MKKLVIVIFAAVLALTSCNSTNPYAGKYSGTFTFVTNNISKNGNLRLVSNPLTSGLLVYGVVPINPVSSNVYISNENNAELITQLLQYVGNQNNIYNAATEQIKNVRVEATFEGNTVYLDMFYEVALISNLLQTRVSIVKFTGTK
ncbi:MAG: hypothetical protein J6T87_02415 [Bacteroidales bacterium]|jgi:hypothetical protein|nr:hypothetical protein [Bacteroidales bacterium]